ncbi:quinoprotein dehydrogenase-associated SoxYZ-like carrier [Candidatus Spongiihabitans sp.]|uniref:quinoprotein dehydrogenase-associated SoxYZ-like carrier n=1 Tax=Candidatus Spongiihabitans sp. TaxID=3101308 RepID=UPI003C7BF128
MTAIPVFRQSIRLFTAHRIRCGVFVLLLSLTGGESALAVSVAPLNNPLSGYNDSSGVNEGANITPRWLTVKREVLGDREIRDGSALISLEAPERAYDAALVPVSVKALQTQTAERYIKTLYLFADNNPAPLSGKFTFPPNTGWQNLETRIRINEYTYVRAVAITNQDQAYMVTRYVKASGGCSAPASGDAEAALANVGKFKLKLESSPVTGENHERIRLNFQIKHPNNSGMQFDQITRLYIPPYFIHTIGVKYNDEEMLNLETNFSLSENPTLRFDFIAKKTGGTIDIYAVDSKLKLFERQWSSSSKM